MRLTKNALNKIDTIPIRLRLASALKKTEMTIRNHINNNPENSLLTTYTALQIIREETKLQDDDILEKTKATA